MPRITKHMRTGVQSSDLDALLASYDAASRRLVEAARARITLVIPAAVERVRSGWRLIGYNAPNYFVFIGVDAGRVRVGFEWGVALTDPERRLEGTGTQVRFISVSSSRDVNNAYFDELLREAAAFRPSSPRRKR